MNMFTLLIIAALFLSFLFFIAVLYFFLSAPRVSTQKEEDCAYRLPWDIML